MFPGPGPDVAPTRPQADGHGRGRDRRNRSTTSRRWPSGRISGAPGRPSICMYRPARSISPAGSCTENQVNVTEIWSYPLDRGPDPLHAGARASSGRRDQRRPCRLRRRPQTAKRPRPHKSRRQAHRPEARRRRKSRRKSGPQQAGRPARPPSRSRRRGSSPAAPPLQPRQARLREHLRRPQRRAAAGASHTRLLYWFRTPPGVRVGRAPLDEDGDPPPRAAQSRTSSSTGRGSSRRRRRRGARRDGPSTRTVAARRGGARVRGRAVRPGAATRRQRRRRGRRRRTAASHGSAAPEPPRPSGTGRPAGSRSPVFRHVESASAARRDGTRHRRGRAGRAPGSSPEERRRLRGSPKPQIAGRGCHDADRRTPRAPGTAESRRGASKPRHVGDRRGGTTGLEATNPCSSPEAP